MDLNDVLRAGRAIAGLLPPTPAWSYPLLDETAGARVVVKHEQVQPTGAFKVRGGLALLAGMSVADRARGVVTYSTGNHAQSIAYACRRFGAPCRIVMPADPNPTKLAAVRALGARVDCHGADLTAAQRYAADTADGMRLVGPAHEEDLVAGVGTAYTELLTAHPDLDALLVPVGGGSGAAAAGVVAAALAPRCEVIGVQSAASPAAHDSWRAGEPVEAPNRTAAEGLATGSGFPLTQRLLRAHLRDFVLVSDEQLRAAQHVLLTRAHTLAEAAGAAGLAALLADPDRYAGRRVGIVVTGGNASPAELSAVLESTATSRPPVTA
ncbi:threonine ammonia-lyase [Actinocatenispora comari]|uniref:threonine ammonia-lyase n=1 Tax=Actinocatenispora comari TaxID=2807577 RepID=A0A8J4A8J6_9ACTN|nr:pyridoxal-phosphate dependent enzyme [Actinocatenispora comari]GIL25669.1 serine/threonine dehydratase [Actinocatenispora comari]